MEGDPDPHAQPSRKRSRHDDPPFHLPPTPEIAPAFPPSRFRDHHSSHPMSSHTPTTAAALADAAANAAAAAAAAAAVTSNPLSSSAPVLQTMHPPIPNFAAIAHPPSSRQAVISHSPNLTDRHHPNTPIYNIALPLPNPGRAHRFCQACDHVRRIIPCSTALSPSLVS